MQQRFFPVSHHSYTSTQSVIAGCFSSWSADISQISQPCPLHIAVGTCRIFSQPLLGWWLMRLYIQNCRQIGTFAKMQISSLRIQSETTDADIPCISRYVPRGLFVRASAIKTPACSCQTVHCRKAQTDFGNWRNSVCGQLKADYYSFAHPSWLVVLSIDISDDGFLQEAVVLNCSLQI